MSSGNGYCWPNLYVFLRNDVFEEPGGKMTERIHGDDLLRVTPLREWANVGSRFRVGEVWLMVDVEILAGDGESVIYGVRSSVSANSCSP